MSRLVVVSGSLAGAWLLKKVFRTGRSVKQDAEPCVACGKPKDGQGSTAEPHASTAKRVQATRLGNTAVVLLLLLAAALVLTVLLARVLSLRAAVLGELCTVATVWVLFGGTSRPQAAREYHGTHKLAGAWVKDKKASSSMDGVLDLAEIHGMLRQAICLLKGCEISVEDGSFNFVVTSALSWFRIMERYPLTGEPKRWRRRDFRRGKHVGSVEQKDDGVCIHLDWEAPVPGYGCDRISSPSEDTLLIQSSICIGGQSASWTAVYRRARAGRRSTS